VGRNSASPGVNGRGYDVGSASHSEARRHVQHESDRRRYLRIGVPTGAQIRIRITAYSSGTVTGAAALTSLPFAPIAVEQTPTNLSATAVSGPTASGVADSGAPVKGATKYNATPPTFTDGNRADMQGDANGFLRVTAQPTNTIASTPTVSTSPAYTSGDSVGGKISLASAVRLAGTGGTITSVTITDKGKQSAATDVVFFNADPSNTTFTDNGALTVHDTDLLTIIGVVPITSWAAFVDNSVGYANGLRARLQDRQRYDALRLSRHTRHADVYGNDGYSARGWYHPRLRYRMPVLVGARRSSQRIAAPMHYTNKVQRSGQSLTIR
jgi:hypothetical protein